MNGKIDRLARDLNALKRQVDGLNTPQLAYSSLEDGAINEYDGDGNLVAIIGTQPDGSHGVVVLDGPEPFTPTTPHVRVTAMSLAARWDGKFIDPHTGAVNEALHAYTDFKHIEVHVGDSADFEHNEATLVGFIPHREGGEVSVPARVGTLYVRFVSRSISDKVSEPSATVPAEVEALVDRQEIADVRADALAAHDLASTASQAATAANNAAVLAQQSVTDALQVTGRVWAQDVAPPGGVERSRDLWINTASGNKPFVWSNITNDWVPVQDTEVTEAMQQALDAMVAAEAAAQAAAEALDRANDAVEDAAEALTSANGRNAIITSVQAASGTTHPLTGRALVVGDTWFQWDNAVSRNVIAQWTWDGSGWSRTYIRDEVIASLDVNKLVVSGSAYMDQAVVNKIIGDAGYFGALSAERLLITPSNLVPDSKMRHADAWGGETFWQATGGNSGGGSVLVPSGTTQRGVYAVTTPTEATRKFLIPVTPGEKYFVSAWVRLSSTSTDPTGVTLYGRFFNEALGVVSTGVHLANIGTTPGLSTIPLNAYTQIVGTFVAPPGATLMTVGPYANPGYTGPARYSDISVEKMVGPVQISDGVINATVEIGTQGRFVATDIEGYQTIMVGSGIEHWGTVGETANPTPQRISRFGRDLQFVTPDGIRGINEEGDGAVRSLSVDNDPVLSGTALLGTLSLQNTEVGLDTELGWLDRLTFGGNHGSETLSLPQATTWTTTGYKRVVELIREQQAGRAILVILYGRARFMSAHDYNQMIWRVLKTSRDLPTSIQPANPFTSGSQFGDIVVTNSNQNVFSFTQIVGIHVPARTEIARWGIEVQNSSIQATKNFRVEQVGLAFLDLGTRFDVPIEMVDVRVPDDVTPPPPPPPPKKTYTSRWYASSVNRWQRPHATPSGDRAGQALQGWTSGMSGSPFDSILGFTGNSHYGETGRTLSAVLNGATIDRVRLRITQAAGFQNVQPRVGIQSSSTATPVANQILAAMSPGQTKYYILTASSFKTGLAQGMRYITFGPGTQSNQSYAAYHGTSGGNSARLELEVTYTR